MIPSVSSLFDNTENLFENPEAYTKDYDVYLIRDNKVISCLLKFEILSGKCVISEKKENGYKLKFKLSDTLNIFTEDQLNPTLVHNIRIRLILHDSKFERTINRFKYTEIYYCYKEKIRNFFGEKIRVERNILKIQLLISTSGMTEIRNEILKNINNDTLTLTSLFSSHRKYTMLTSREFELSASFELLKDYLNKAQIDLETFDYSKYKEVLRNLDVTQCNGLLLIDNNINVHNVINAIFSRKDTLEFLLKIPIGVFPYQGAQGISKTIGMLSREEINEEAAAFMLAKGKFRQFDIMEVHSEYSNKKTINEEINTINNDTQEIKIEEDEEEEKEEIKQKNNIVQKDTLDVIYSIINISWCKNGEIEANNLRSTSCCQGITKYFQKIGIAMSKTTYLANLEYNIFEFPAGNNNESTQQLKSMRIDKRDDTSFGDSILSIPKEKGVISQDKALTFFTCANIPFVYPNKFWDNGINVNDGFCELIYQENGSSGFCDLYEILSDKNYSTQLNEKNAHTFYIKTNQWKLKQKANTITSFYIDGKEYNFSEISVCVLPRRIKIFCLENS